MPSLISRWWLPQTQGIEQRTFSSFSDKRNLSSCGFEYDARECAGSYERDILPSKHALSIEVCLNPVYWCINILLVALLNYTVKWRNHLKSSNHSSKYTTHIRTESVRFELAKGVGFTRNPDLNLHTLVPMYPGELIVHWAFVWRQILAELWLSSNSLQCCSLTVFQAIN